MSPWLPPGATASLAGRGEVFFRSHRHPDPTAPTLLLLHGWTADADTQFFGAYQALAERYSFVAPDHRGHGRGMRAVTPFTLEDVADDAAALVRHLGLGPVVTVGYSMGGPISLQLARRHPELVAGMVLQATALDWRATWRDRATWWVLPALGPALRSWTYPRVARRVLARMVGVGNEHLADWIGGELRRNDPVAMVQAGRALSRYDARPFAGTLRRPAAALITTEDRVVRPVKQWALAQTLGAHTETLAADHLCTITEPAAYAAATRRLVDRVVDEIGHRAGGDRPTVAAG
jgi:pimeloyl-ACP methyl ester carboxylesterase